MTRLSMLALSVLLLVACGGSEPATPALAPADAARLLVDRNWLDRMPRDERERLQVYRFTPAMGGGVFQDRTLYAGHFELFTFKTEGTQLKINLPHKKQVVATGYTIRRVRGHEPFDLQLTFDHSPRGPKVYYGFSNESAAETDVAALIAARR